MSRSLFALISVPLAVTMTALMLRPAGTEAAADTDGDGWSDAYEQYLGTNPTSACNTEPINPDWPPDMTNNNFVDTADIAAVTFWFGAAVATPGAPARFDIGPNSGINTAGDGFIDTADIAQITGRFGNGC